MEKFLASQKKIHDIVMHDPIALKNPMQFVRQAVKDIAIEQLNKSIAGCTACPCCSKTKTIGYGKANAAVMVIMDYSEESQAKLEKTVNVFEGDPSLKSFLERCFNSFGVNMEEIFFMNTVNCCPTYQTGDSKIFRAPKKDECESCSTFVKYAVDIIQPQMIILMGNVALNVFRRGVISKCRGTFIDAHCIPAMPTYSPVYLKDLKGQIDETERIQKFKDFKNDIGNAVLDFKRKWPNSPLFVKKEEN